jgi:hypothetical protein
MPFPTTKNATFKCTTHKNELSHDLVPTSSLNKQQPVKGVKSKLHP